MMTPAIMAELALASAPHGAGVTAGPGEVLVVTIVPHKVGAPVRPDTRVKYWPGQVYACSVASAEHAHARDLVHILGRDEYDWWHAPGRVLSPLGAASRPYATAPSVGALRIAQGCGYDPGNAAYRFHSAINQASKHASMFVRWGHTNPYTDLRQLDGATDASAVRDAVMNADVLHNHIGYFLPNNCGLSVQPGQVLVLHYHGSRPDGKPLCADRWPGSRLSCLAWDRMRGAKVVGARLSLVEEIRRFAESEGIPIVPEWLPITIDVSAYRALVPSTPRTGPFRIAHSPTNRRFKGSDVYDRVVSQLQARGLPIESVTISGMSHGDALRMKATCHAVFDSFWLGMQGSGLEGAAMGLPVIAGDPDAARAHVDVCGAVPWTYANDEGALSQAIERLATDPAFYATEAARVTTFVAAYHDYAPVARRYEDLLAKWTGREDVHTETRSSEARPIGASTQQSTGLIPEVGGASPPASPSTPRRKPRRRVA